MAQTKFQLNAEMREGTGSGFAKKLRRQGVVPGVIYGGGQRNYPIQVKEKSISDLLKTASSVNVLVNLEIDGAKEKNKLVLIQEIENDVMTGKVTHVDFKSVRDDEEIRATLPITLHGEPAGVKQGGLLEQQLYDLEITCLPGDLPETLDFDVTELTLGQALHIGEVEFPKGVRPNLNDQVLIAIVSETRVAKAEAAVGEEGGEEPAAAAAAEG